MCWRIWRSNLYDAIPDDPAREVLTHAKSTAVIEQMLVKEQLGRKTDGGFYQMQRSEDGRRELWALDLATMEYAPPSRPQFESVTVHGKVA